MANNSFLRQKFATKSDQKLSPVFREVFKNSPSTVVQAGVTGERKRKRS